VHPDPVLGRTLYPSFSFVLTTAPLVPGTAAVSRLRTLNRFTLADVSWSRLRKMDDGVDVGGRRSLRLPSENKGFDVRCADNTLLMGCAATGTATPSGGCKQLNSETDRRTCKMQSRRAKERQEARGWRHVLLRGQGVSLSEKFLGITRLSRCDRYKMKIKINCKSIGF
jgi:hypothetical protein